MNRSPSTEQGVLSQFSGFSEEIEHFTRDPCTTQPKSCIQSTTYAFKEQEVNTCTNCEYSYRHMDDHLTQNTPAFLGKQFLQGKEKIPAFLGKQFLQGKEKITCPDIENIPAPLWNQPTQGNEKNVDTCTFIPGSTTPSRHSMLSIPTHSRKVPQNFQQLEKESSNTMALPGFNHNAEATTHIETSRNVHSNGALSTSLKMDTNMNANMYTNHTAHRYRHKRKEDHLLSEPSELRPLKTMAHQYTRKEAHLLSRPSELQPTEDSETQKFNSTHVQHTRQEYSQLTEKDKAKFQNPFIYNDDRNFVWHNSVSKISPNLVFMTTQNIASVSNSVFCRKKGRKCGECRGCTCSRRTCTCTYSRRTCTCICNHTGVTTLQEQGKVNRELWETSQ